MDLHINSNCVYLHNYCNNNVNINIYRSNDVNNFWILFFKKDVIFELKCIVFLTLFYYTYNDISAII